MKSERLTAWRSLDKSIETMLYAKPFELSEAARDLERARDIYAQVVSATGKDSTIKGWVATLRDNLQGSYRRLQSQTKEKELRRKAALLKFLPVFLFLVVGAGLFVNAQSGVAVAMGYFVTALGLILVTLGLLISSKFLQNVVTLLGVVLAGGWYLYSLPGVFHPVDHAVLNVQPDKSGYTVNVIVEGEKRLEKCSFAPKTSTLTCEVKVEPTVLPVPKA
ncbi:hypothetical protein ACIOWE_02410 [Pseudomonas sp. NPDC087598]|uniref:hypothetical protein n=1 Tax=Pseudomonas sp. NPDC087598 TaxID=3364440 RepID=UPI0037F5C7BE